MSEFIEQLNQRFGKENVQTIYFKHSKNSEFKEKGIDDYPFILVNFEMRSSIKILMTSSLNSFKMPVLERFKGREFNELYFCLPSYWDVEDLENENMNWIFDSLFRLQNYVLEKNSWFGVGHTVPFANPFSAMSKTMKQSYFFFSDPLFVKDKLHEIKVADREIHFLGIIPIFEDEFDYKIGKGTFKFLKKLGQKNVTELLDDFRGTVLKNNWKFFK